MYDYNHQAPRFWWNTAQLWAICGHQQLPAEYFNWGTPHHVAKKNPRCSSGLRQRWGKGPRGFSMATPNPPTDRDYWGFSNPLLGAPQWGYPQEPRVNHDLLSFWFITVRNQSPAIGNLPFSDWKAVTKVRWAWKIPSQKPTNNTCFMHHPWQIGWWKVASWNLSLVYMWASRNMIVYHGVSTNLDMQIFRIPYSDNPAE